MQLKERNGEKNTDNMFGCSQLGPCYETGNTKVTVLLTGKLFRMHSKNKLRVPNMTSELFIHIYTQKRIPVD
jgi:hypothetical protein